MHHNNTNFLLWNLKTSQNDEGMQNEFIWKNKNSNNDARKRKPKFLYKKCHMWRTINMPHRSEWNFAHDIILVLKICSQSSRVSRMHDTPVHGFKKVFYYYFYEQCLSSFLLLIFYSRNCLWALWGHLWWSKHRVILIYY